MVGLVVLSVAAAVEAREPEVFVATTAVGLAAAEAPTLAGAGTAAAGAACETPFGDAAGPRPRVSPGVVVEELSVRTPPRDAERESLDVLSLP